MLRYSEMEVYGVDGETPATEEELDYYKEELDKIRAENSGIIIARIVPDEDDGHIDCKVFQTWTDAEIWKNQK